MLEIPGYQAALQVDAEQIFQLIEQIPQNHCALAQRLSELVENFCCDGIMELVVSS